MTPNNSDQGKFFFLTHEHVLLKCLLSKAESVHGNFTKDSFGNFCEDRMYQLNSNVYRFFYGGWGNKRSFPLKKFNSCEPHLIFIYFTIIPTCSLEHNNIFIMKIHHGKMAASLLQNSSFIPGKNDKYIFQYCDIYIFIVGHTFIV